MALGFILFFATLYTVIVKKNPNLVIFFSLLFPFFSLPIAVSNRNQDFGSLFLLVQFLGFLGVIALLLTRKPKIEPHQFLLIIFMLLALGYGVLISNSEMSNVPMRIIGAKFLILPIVFALAGSVNLELANYILKFSLVLVILNAAAALFELTIGYNFFIKYANKYTFQPTQFLQSRFRAPGLTLSNFTLGYFAATTLLIVIANRLINPKIQKFNLLQKAGIISSLFAIFASYSRGALVMLAAGVTMLFIAYFRYLPMYLLALAIIGLTIFSVGFRTNYFDGTSGRDRFAIWAFVKANSNFGYGWGLGTSGATTNSSFALFGHKVIVDNYFLSIFWQIGFIGLILYTCVLVVLSLQMDKIGRSLILALALANMFIEFWEYTEVVSILMIYSLAKHPKVKAPLSPKLN